MKNQGTKKNDRAFINYRPASAGVVVALGRAGQIARRTLWHELTPALALFNMGFGAKFKPGFARVKV